MLPKNQHSFLVYNVSFAVNCTNNIANMTLTCVFLRKENTFGNNTIIY